MTKKKKLLILLFASFFLILILCVGALIFYYFWLNNDNYLNKNKISGLIFTKKINELIIDKKVEKFIIDAVGKEYFKNNYRFIKSELGNDIEPMDGFNGHEGLKYYYYEFLPFSDKYQYTVSAFVDIDGGATFGYFSNDFLVPKCAKDIGSDRCEFNFTYSQAYDLAQKKLGEGLVSYIIITKKRNEDKYRWYASNNHAFDGYYYSVYIDTDNGSTSQIEKISSPLW